MIPQFFPKRGLRQLRNTHALLIRRDMFCHNIHGHLAQIQIGSDSCCCRHSCNIINIFHDFRRDKDDVLLAEAFELAAGKSISTLTLNEAPEFGNVDCTVTIVAYRDGKQVGSVQTELTLHTAYLWPKEVQ